MLFQLDHCTVILVSLWDLLANSVVEYMPVYDHPMRCARGVGAKLLPQRQSGRRVRYLTNTRQMAINTAYIDFFLIALMADRCSFTLTVR